MLGSQPAPLSMLNLDFSKQQASSIHPYQCGQNARTIFQHSITYVCKCLVKVLNTLRIPPLNQASDDPRLAAQQGKEGKGSQPKLSKPFPHPKIPRSILPTIHPSTHPITAPPPSPPAFTLTPLPLPTSYYSFKLR